MSTPESVEPAPESPEKPAAKPKSRRRRLLTITGVVAGVLALICGGTALGVWLYAQGIEDRVKRLEAFAEVPEDTRPPKLASQAMNLLVLGSDKRDDPSNPGGRSDTIMLVHISGDRTNAQLISIPRDTWVHIPRRADGKEGGVDAKINHGLKLGGPALAVQTVEAFTKVRIDHVVMIEFSGFKEIVDALGGVTITVEETFTSVHDDHRVFKKGTHLMNGEEALDYSRQRKQFKEGDLARIEHQQQVVRAVIDKALAKGLNDPAKLNAFLKSTADALTADKQLSMVDLALQLRGLRSKDLTFVTSPSKGFGKVGDQVVIWPDQEKAAKLYAAVNADQMTAWLLENAA